MPVCQGQHLDRILFSVPQLRPLQKLRIFPCDVELKLQPEDPYVVSRRQVAEIAVHRASEGRMTIEHLKGPIALHGRPRLTIEETDLPQILSGIASLYDCLGLGTAKTQTNWTQKLWSRLRRLITWDTDLPQRSCVEMYHYKDNRAPKFSDEISRLDLQDGVASLAKVPKDHVFGMKITNTSEKPVYPYLVHFDSSTYEIKVLHSPFPKDGRGPPKPIQPEASLIFGHALNETSTWGHRPSLRVTPDKSEERTAELLKIILSEKPIDLGYMAQPSPMLAPRERAVPEVIPGVWTEETVVLEVPADHFY
uniref:MSP domain-containing protein n=1 Tax=Mycena chlorophos TaxID=658473 RepID=A0ABQ0LAJ4_MYCCL|nr:predicted protein [Mycena chlorophos]